MKTKIPVVVLLPIVTVFFLSSCVSRTRIVTNPPGAEVFADGVSLGPSPAEYSDAKIIGAKTTIRVQKDGCQPMEVMLERTEKFSPVACAGGVLCLFPFLWLMGYQDQHEYTMDCSGAPSE